MPKQHPPRPMSPADFHALMSDYFSGELGEDEVFLSNVSPFSHVHVGRIGKAANPLARIILAAHEIDDEGEHVGAEVILSPAEARILAATLCNIADDADGTDPLSLDHFVRDEDPGE